MTPNRTLLAALGLATAAALTLTACSAKSSPTAAGTTAPPTQSTPTATQPPSAADQLTTAIRQLQAGVGFNFTLNEGYAGGPLLMNGVGSYDPVAGAITLDLKGTLSGTHAEFAETETGLSHTVSTNHKVWVKINDGTLNTRYAFPRTKWMAMDPGKIDGPSPLLFDVSGQFDILDVSQLLASVSGVHMTSAVAMAGTVDLNKAGGVIAPEGGDLSKNATRAAATPFTAVLDSQGRLVTLTVDTRSWDKAFYRVVSFTDYGSPHTIKPPPSSSVVTATAKNYAFFTS